MGIFKVMAIILDRMALTPSFLTQPLQSFLTETQRNGVL